MRPALEDRMRAATMVSGQGAVEHAVVARLRV
jgi:hypothetical protein